MGLCFFAETKAQTKTEVLVIGTIHNGHDNNPNYSEQDILNILGTYNPDVIVLKGVNISKPMIIKQKVNKPIR